MVPLCFERTRGLGSFRWAGTAGEVDHGALEGSGEIVQRDAEALGLFQEPQLDELLEAIGWEGGEGAVRAHQVGQHLPGGGVQVRAAIHGVSSAAGELDAESEVGELLLDPIAVVTLDFDGAVTHGTAGADEATQLDGETLHVW